MNSLSEAFEDLVKDMYNAEKQVVKALPKAAKAASSEDLKAGFEEHKTQTEGHIERLEKVAEICGFKPTGKVCKAAQGLIEEMAEIIEEGEPGPVTDAMLICGGQKFEHYEIANYGTAVAWAKLIGQDECVNLLQQTLDEEQQTNMKLNELAEGSINEEAMNSSEEEGKSQSRKSTSGSSSASVR